MGATYAFIVWQIYFFFLIYANKFNIIYTDVCIYNTNAYPGLSDSHKYFHLAAILFFHVYDYICILD